MTQCHCLYPLYAAVSDSLCSRLSERHAERLFSVSIVCALRHGCQRRFPESTSSSHFWSNLLAGKNMCTEDDRRFAPGLYGTPTRFGKLVEYNLFDASFFSVHGKQAQVSHSLM